MINKKFWQNKRVLITGHTGFKGSWLSIWLNSLGAKVHGISLPPESEECLFSQAKVESIISNNVIEFPEQTLNFFPETLELVPLISRSFKH